MQNMRTLAALYLKFNEIAIVQSKENIKVKGMFIRTSFRMLEDAIEQLSVDDSNSLKSEAKSLLGNVLKRSIKVFKGFFLMNGNDKGAEELDKIAAVLNARWGVLFANAESEVVCNRQETLRRPEELALEEDVTKVRQYTVSEIENILRLITITSSAYVQLRNLTVTRLTFFNARRGGEPSRIILPE